MARRKYTIRPAGLVGVTSAFQANVQPSSAGIVNSNYYTTYNTQNFKTTQKTIKKRWGTGVDITVYSSSSANKWVSNCYGYIKKAGTYVSPFFIAATSVSGEGADLGISDIADGKWQYITRAYTTGTVTNITDVAESVVTGNGTTWSTNAAAGDYFIVNETSDFDADEEPQANWMEIKTVDNDTTLTLVGNYAGTTGAQTSDYIIRKVYTGHTPSNKEDWADFTVLNDTLYIAIPNNAVQKYGVADTYCSDLDTTYANDAKHLIEYADRLVLANVDDTAGNPGPCTVRWSKNGDPTDWTDSTAGSADLLETTDPITGLSKIGSNLVVYKPNSITLGYRTGIATAPIAFNSEIVGIGCPAPKSIVEANGTNYFVGYNNIYKIEGQIPIPIGDAIRDYFFSKVTSDLRLHYVFGFHNFRDHEIIWFPGPAESSYAYSYDYLENTWNRYRFSFIPSGCGNMYYDKTASQTELVPVLGDNTKIYRCSYDYTADAYVDGDTSQNMYCYWRTCQTDFADQDPEALGKWKTVYRVDITYVDLTASASLTAIIQADGAAVSTMSSNTFGAGDSRVKRESYYTITHGDTFQLFLYNASKTSKLHILSIDIFYEIGGTAFEI